MIVQAQVQSKRRSVWDIFGGAQLQNVPYKPVSNGVTINVKALPEAGKPENFSGAVGKFTFQTNISQKESKTDEGVTYTVKVSGTGNMKTFELPKPNVPDAFEVYDPKTKEDIVAGTSGTKQADYLIIPRQPGDFKIEPSGKIHQHSSSGIRIKNNGWAFESFRFERWKCIKQHQQKRNQITR